MDKLYQGIGITFFTLLAISSGVFSVVIPFLFKKKGVAKGIKYRAIGLSIAVSSVVFALELFKPNVICIPFWAVFIGLVWLEFFLSPFRRSKM